MTPSTIAHYRISAKLGEGGMGEVWRATDTKLNRDVAVKILPEGFAQDADRMARFEREAQVLASLNHPNIAAIYGVEERALIMELVEGETLHGPLPVETALHYARQIAEALEYAHERGIIHRDLKPANIKVTREGRVKVLDFGLAKALSSEGAAGNPHSSPTLTMRATMAGVILGTAAYMSPEQARGQDVDRRADIWAFGVVLYEMLTGQQFFGGATISDTLAAVLTREPDLAAVPAQVRPIIERCLRKDPRHRWQAIGDVRIALDEAPPSAAAAAQSLGVPAWWRAVAILLTITASAVSLLHFREKPPEPVAVRFQIAPPEKATYGNGMALSPDGKRLAFIAFFEGRSLLWVRPLDSLTAQALPGTDGAQFPFWSPDSRFIGFFVTGKLKKVEASGGPPQTLCDVSNTGVGGSWNHDGVVVFGTNASGLFRVPQAGGVAAPLTTPDTGRQEAFHARPWFLPDGRHLLYYAQSNTVESSAIYLVTLDGKQRKRMVAARQGAAYVPPATTAEKGHLLFLRDGTLMGQPLDPKSFESAGDAFPVAEQVGSSISNPFFSVSTNGVLVYRAGGRGGNTQLAWFDREGKPGGVVGPIGVYNAVALSPDGKRVAASKRDPQTGNQDIWLMDVARGVPTRFTFDPALDTDPVWSPDGSRLVFTSSRDGAFNLYQKGSDGAGSEEPLLKSASAKYSCDWSGDGRYLLYSTLDPKTKSDLWVLPDPAGPSTERKPRPFLATPYNESQGQFSPGPAGTARWIAYTSDESGRYEVYVQPFSETTSGTMGKFQISSDGGTAPRWRGDGKELYYTALDGRLMAVEMKSAPRFEHGVPKALFLTRILGAGAGMSGLRYAATLDGRRFLINSQAEEAASVPITAILNWTAGLKR